MNSLTDFLVEAALEVDPTLATKEQSVDLLVEQTIQNKDGEYNLQQVECIKARKLEKAKKKVVNPCVALEDKALQSVLNYDVMVDVVWDEPYTSPPSILKERNVCGNFDKTSSPPKNVQLKVPGSHKSGFHPTRRMDGDLVFKKADRGSIDAGSSAPVRGGFFLMMVDFACKAFIIKSNKAQLDDNDMYRIRAEERLMCEVLSEKFCESTRVNLTPPNPLPEILGSSTTLFDLIILVMNNPNDFFVKLGDLSVRRKFNYMEANMKTWYTKKFNLLSGCEFQLKDVEVLNYYAMHYVCMDEFVRIQVSNVEKDIQKNPQEKIVAALIDYGGYIECSVHELLPLMPYFAQLPRMAFRGVLSLTTSQQENFGRTDYTSEECSIFVDTIASREGLVEGLMCDPGDEYTLKGDPTFPVVELILFVIESGKRRSLYEIMTKDLENSQYFDIKTED